MILAGDVGGTSIRLALFQDNLAAPCARQDVRCSDHPTLADAVRAFAATGHGRIDAACFGVAGPVSAGRVAMTNLPWVVDAEQLRRDLGIPRVSVINDLAAMALGVAALGAHDLEVLQAGTPDARGHRAVIAAGTGLGQAILFHDGVQHRAIAGEGGHVDFAARDALEAELLIHLRGIHGHVSCERVVSGDGLVALYRFLRDARHGIETAAVAQRMRAGDAAAVIAAAALTGECSLCVLALDRFASLYAAEAGNLALKANATGGVFIGGGIAPKIIARLRAPDFVATFCDKGRMRPLMEAMPLSVIMSPDTALLGAMRVACEDLRGR
jgi:glucokinase